MKAGRELDKLVAEKVMGWRLKTFPSLSGLLPDISVWIKGHNTFVSVENFNPSTNIADAFEVLKALKKKGIQAEISTSDFSVRLYKWETDPPPYRYKRHLVRIDVALSFDEIPFAICLAALEVERVGVDD